MSGGRLYFRKCDNCMTKTELRDTSAKSLTDARRAGWFKWGRFYKAEVCAACAAKLLAKGTERLTPMAKQKPMPMKPLYPQPMPSAAGRESVS